MQHIFGTCSQRKPNPPGLAKSKDTQGHGSAVGLRRVAWNSDPHRTEHQKRQDARSRTVPPVAVTAGPAITQHCASGWATPVPRLTAGATGNAAKTSLLPSSRPTDPTAHQTGPSGAARTPRHVLVWTAPHPGGHRLLDHTLTFTSYTYE